ncbi:MAG: hypothetical protein COU29_02800 [Candidatus Magasanikbacteria bacterium CG10_big_fil_rev_8_21_14_0_10_36_32]|uniref:Uncharacterized protein n=1 Tax=Candidatus Magasanikbacteria bacterium CG10_big_fil_rev_8_21_14_0_10_36_32 TaxID=1974646 RepID=A0A2M6W7B1_9BACT|nr:MAG: hypothetical protein COU29_02800 [Candidatus Magasanikbacteria bacterium CG10_big_fil_rev_8_21_14_0_10_36_32]
MKINHICIAGFKEKINKITKKEIFLKMFGIILSTAIATFLIIVVILYFKTPTITILEPQNDSSVQTTTIMVKGTVNLATTKLLVNNHMVEIKRGKFNYKWFLTEEKNILHLVATNENSNKTIESVLNINRIMTEEEKIALEVQKKAVLEAQEKAEEERKAKELAEQKTWEQSKAGKLCTKYPLWTKEDCENIANRKLWIGMTYDMLVESSGSKPDSAHLSNYGDGTRWQWCWYDYNPSCFYDDNNDGIIDAYN